jgi:hypothetical protein
MSNTAAGKEIDKLATPGLIVSYQVVSFLWHWGIMCITLLQQDFLHMTYSSFDLFQLPKTCFAGPILVYLLSALL